MEDAQGKIINTVCSRNCYSACGLRAHVRDGRVVKISGNPNNPATYGLVCSKGLSFPHTLYGENRLLYPMKRIGQRGEGRFLRIGWPEAIDTACEALSRASERYGPESVLYYAASGNHGGAMQAYAYGFWNQLEGYSATRGSLCAAAANEGVRYTYGIVKDSAIKDIETARLILLWGKNPAHTNIHTMRYIRAAMEHGGKLVTIDPRLGESGAGSSLHLYPRCGTDGLVAIALAKMIVSEGLLDREFLVEHAQGYAEYRQMLERFTIEEICEKTEIPLAEFERLYALIRETPRFLIILGKGFQRNSNGGQTTRGICLLPALTGGVGKSGSGLFYSDAQRPKFVWPYLPPQPERVRRDISIGRIASEIADKQNPPIRAMWIERANPMTSNPNVGKLKSAMEQLDFIACSDLFLTDTARMADLVLPAASFLEEDDLVFSYGHSYIQRKQKAVEPPGECKTDREIYRMLGVRFGMDQRYLPADDLEILRRVIKESGLRTSLEQLDQEPYLFSDYNEIAFSDGVFPTSSGKIEFYSEAIAQDWGADPLPVFVEPLESKYTAPELYRKYPLQLMSPHAREKTNSQPYSLVNSTPYVQMHPQDAAEREIRDGDTVRLFNDRGEIFLAAQIADKSHRGVVCVFFGEWGGEHLALNVLNEDRETDIGYGTCYYNCLVQAEKYAQGEIR
ncbi:MAG TPA: molybdopterin-dependent oxidoreductase [Candidatus Cryosericum sp.]|nr:molybdopterin-dependent oxidoreductase [Candidatus Cryosericum sp.]